MRRETNLKIKSVRHLLQVYRLISEGQISTCDTQLFVKQTGFSNLKRKQFPNLFPRTFSNLTALILQHDLKLFKITGFHNHLPHLFCPRNLTKVIFRPVNKFSSKQFSFQQFSLSIWETFKISTSDKFHIDTLTNEHLSKIWREGDEMQCSHMGILQDNSVNRNME